MKKLQELEKKYEELGEEIEKLKKKENDKLEYSIENSWEVFFSLDPERYDGSGGDVIGIRASGESGAGNFEWIEKSEFEDVIKWYEENK